jgi:glucuronate isomerase
MKTKSNLLVLNKDRFFDPNPAVRSIARKLYQSIKDLPIISPHGHVDPRLFAENRPFPNPAELFIIPDHYIFRMLYSQGISLESLGIPRKDGTRGEQDPRKIWKLFAENYHLFRGTPSGVWLDHEFSVVFGIKERLNGKSALRIYDEIEKKLRSPAFLPRALFDRFKIEALATTDSATDTLEYHDQIRKSGWKGRILPSFRPDALTNLRHPQWQTNRRKLGQLVGNEIETYGQFIDALEERRRFFKSMGAVATDHGVFSPWTHLQSAHEADAIFQRALRNRLEKNDAELFTAHMLMEMARMSVEDGLVMQIHPGADRDHNQMIFEEYGSDKGADIPSPTEYTQNLKELLNTFGNNPNFTVVVFTLDETTYSRELAPLAGVYPAMKLGPPWWFHDSIEGMRRYRSTVMETAGLYNTVGFNDDTRAFVSIPARHDLARRMDSDYLASLVVRHIIGMQDAFDMVYQLANGLVKKAYKLDGKD